MFRVIKVEQTRDGRWAVVQEAVDGSRRIIEAFPTVEQASEAVVRAESGRRPAVAPAP